MRGTIKYPSWSLCQTKPVGWLILASPLHFLDILLYTHPWVGVATVYILFSCCCPCVWLWIWHFLLGFHDFFTDFIELCHFCEIWKVFLLYQINHFLHYVEHLSSFLFSPYTWGCLSYFHQLEFIQHFFWRQRNKGWDYHGPGLSFCGYLEQGDRRSNQALTTLPPHGVLEGPPVPVRVSIHYYCSHVYCLKIWSSTLYSWGFCRSSSLCTI